MTAIADFGPPLCIWDTRGVESAWLECFTEASAWAKVHIKDANSTYRAEFYLIDGPFAVVYRYVRDEDGHVRWDPGTESAMRAEPVVQVLDELPPAHLMRV